MLQGSRGGVGAGVQIPLKNHKNRVFNNTGLDPLKNQKANVGQSTTRQRNAI